MSLEIITITGTVTGIQPLIGKLSLIIRPILIPGVRHSVFSISRFVALIAITTDAALIDLMSLKNIIKTFATTDSLLVTDRLLWPCVVSELCNMSNDRLYDRNTHFRLFLLSISSEQYAQISLFTLSLAADWTESPTPPEL